MADVWVKMTTGKSTLLSKIECFGCLSWVDLCVFFLWWGGAGQQDFLVGISGVACGHGTLERGSWKVWLPALFDTLCFAFIFTVVPLDF